MTAESLQDSVIFTRNGHIHLGSKNIKLTPAEGFAPVVARMTDVADPSADPEVRITLGDEFTIPGYKFATTTWMDDGNGTSYAQTVLVPEDTVLDENGFLDDLAKAATGPVTVESKPADYTAVDEAIAAAQALNKEDYSDFSAVDQAIADVVRNKNITEQDEVDAMAKAINTAVSGLKKSPSVDPSKDPSKNDPKDDSKNPSKNPSVSSSKTDATKTATKDAGSGSPKTGDNSGILYWTCLMILSAGVLLYSTKRSFHK